MLVVNEALAQLYWPNERNILGRCIRVGSESQVCREIVGVVTNHRFTSGLNADFIPAYFLPVAQALEYGAPPRLFVRVSGDAERMVPQVRSVVQGFVPNLPAVDVHPVQEQVDPLLASWRLGAFAFTALGAVAVTVALLGLFSVLAFFVAERNHEFAIRIALGARAAQVLVPVLRLGVLAVGGGALLGIAAAIWLARWIQPLLFNTVLLDPLVIALTLLGLLGLAAAAALTPAWQAARNDPASTLRAV